MSDDLSLRQWVDRQAITQLLHRYCRAVDRLDVALGQAIWLPDATADYGDFFQGPGSEVIERICAAHAQLLYTSHQVTNVLIDVSGDSAGSEAYCLAAVRMAAEGGERQMTIWTRYLDRWERRDGGWGLRHRIALRDFDAVELVTPMARDHRSRRDGNDPSYRVLHEEQGG